MGTRLVSCERRFSSLTEDGQRRELKMIIAGRPFGVGPSPFSDYLKSNSLPYSEVGNVVSKWRVWLLISVALIEIGDRFAPTIEPARQYTESIASNMAIRKHSHISVEFTRHHSGPRARGWLHTGYNLH